MEKKSKKGPKIAAFLIILLMCGGSYYYVRTTKLGKEKTLALVNMYLSKGEYDRALDKVEELLLKNPDDESLKALMDDIIQKKKNTAKEGEDLEKLMEAMKAELEDSHKAQAENQRAMNNLLKQQKAQAEQERKRQQEQERKEREIESKRKAEEALKQQKELELAKKNAALKKEITQVNDAIDSGTTALNNDDIDGAIAHFHKADSLLPVSEGEPGFSVNKRSAMASLMFTKSAQEKEINKTKLEQESVLLANKILKDDEKNPVANYIIGMTALNSKDPDKALQYLSKASQYDNTNYEYFYNLGRAQYMMKKYEASKASFTKSCQLNSTFVQSRYNLGLTNNKLNDSKSALLDFRRARELDPHHEKAHFEEARILTKTKDYDNAIKSFQTVVNLNSSNIQAYQELGSVYSIVGKYKESEACFKKALSLENGKKDARTFYNLSTVLYEQSKNEEAYDYALKAYECLPSITDKVLKTNVIYIYALVLEKRGNANEALKLYNEALVVNPDHIKSMVNKAAIYLNMNVDADKSLEILMQAYQKDSKNFEVNNNLGNVYLYKKDYKTAISYYQEAIKIDSNSSEAKFNLAQCYASDSQYAEAQKLYKEIAKLPSGAYNYDALLELSKVLLAMGNNTEAEKYLRFIEKTNPAYKAQEVKDLLSKI